MLMIVSRLDTSRFPQGKAIVAGSKVQFCRAVMQACSIYRIFVSGKVGENEKGPAFARPSIKIAGAQEGTRTPTELPAST